MGNEKVIATVETVRNYLMFLEENSLIRKVSEVEVIGRDVENKKDKFKSLDKNMLIDM